MYISYVSVHQYMMNFWVIVASLDTRPFCSPTKKFPYLLMNQVDFGINQTLTK